MLTKTSSGRLQRAPQRPARSNAPRSTGSVANPATPAPRPTSRFAAPKSGRGAIVSSVKKRKTESSRFER